MRALKFRLVLLRVCVIVSTLWTGSAVLFAQDHNELMHNVPLEKAPITIFDPRLSVHEVRYALVKGHVIIQGDIDLGPIEEVTKIAEAHAAAQFAPHGGKEHPTLKWLLDAEAADATYIRVKQQSAPSTDEEGRKFDAAREKVIAIYKEHELPQDLGNVHANSSIIVSDLTGVYRWPNGVIPYVIDPSYPTPELVQKAIDHWHAKTNKIRFVQKGPQDTHWIKIQLADGCSSRVGMALEATEQAVNLASGCLVPQIIHELGHAVGLWHEQSRNDRDGYIIINLQNVSPGYEPQFDKTGTSGLDVGGFDFGSIMLYPYKAFSANNNPTMIRRDNPTDMKWGIDTGPMVGGVTIGLSAGDLAGVDLMYPSPAKP